MCITAQHTAAIIFVIIAAAIGAASLIAFAYFLYAGPLHWVDLPLDEAQRLGLNTLLSLVFFLQHSGMVRKPFRRLLAGVIPSHYHGAVYTVASGVVLLGVTGFWQASEIVIFEVHGLIDVLLRCLFFLSLLGMCWGMWALRSIDMFGLDPILGNLRGKSSSCKPFTVQGPYRWIRHPLYLLTIVLFWSYPTLTADRLLFNILWTIWVVVGTMLEERDLAGDFGKAYRDYQETVPMLVPRHTRPGYPAHNQDEPR